MPHRGRYRLSSVTAWGLAALFAAAVSAAPARATCGDYVHVRTGDGPTAWANLPGPPADAPCHGPNCSQRDHTPPLAPVAPPTPSGPTDAILAADPPADPRSVGHTGDDAVHFPVGLVADPFHPPRAG